MTDQIQSADRTIAAAPLSGGVGRFFMRSRRCRCRCWRRWDRAVCRLHSMRCDWFSDPPATPSVFGLDGEMCGMVLRSPRHRARWGPTLERMKGDWEACASDEKERGRAVPHHPV